MKLYGCPRARSSRIVWILEESGTEYDLVPVDIRDPEATAEPGFQAARPMGKVQALDDGGVRVADSAAICLYLADQYGQGRLTPPVDHP